MLVYKERSQFNTSKNHSQGFLQDFPYEDHVYFVGWGVKEGPDSAPLNLAILQQRLSVLAKQFKC